jgi:hypothetical protein
MGKDLLSEPPEEWVDATRSLSIWADDLEKPSLFR